MQTSRESCGGRGVGEQEAGACVEGGVPLKVIQPTPLIIIPNYIDAVWVPASCCHKSFYYFDYI